MIYFLNGTISQIIEDTLIIDVQGIGYQVYVPSVISSRLDAIGTSMILYTYHHIREDTQLLFGFSSQDDRALFMSVISVSGVGPKVGLKILSQLNRDQLVQAIMSEQIQVLTSVSGVGKKMAERLILELKDKIALIAATHNIEVSDSPGVSSDNNQELTQALKTLGYNKDEIKNAYMQVGDQLSGDQPLEDSIKLLLKAL